MKTLRLLQRKSLSLKKKQISNNVHYRPAQAKLAPAATAATRNETITKKHEETKTEKIKQV
jgi:hypothetical protein